jgi:hypothetical protein
VSCFSHVSLVRVGSGQFLAGWRCFVWLCDGFFFLAGFVLGLFLFQGLEKSLRLSGMLVMQLLQPPS